MSLAVSFTNPSTQLSRTYGLHDGKLMVPFVKTSISKAVSQPRPPRDFFSSVSRTVTRRSLLRTRLYNVVADLTDLGPHPCTKTCFEHVSLVGSLRANKKLSKYCCGEGDPSASRWPKE